MLDNNRQCNMYDPKSEIFNNHVISIFTDASVRYNKNNTRQHTVIGGLIVEPYEKAIRKTELIPLKNKTVNFDVTYAELCAIYYTLELLLDEERFGKLKKIYQINVYSDNITAVKLMRTQLLGINTLRKNGDLESVHISFNKFYSEKIAKVLGEIYQITHKLKKPVIAFHIKAHLLKSGKASIKQFREDFFKLNQSDKFKIETKLFDSDIKEMILYNDIVDKKVREINDSWKFNK